MTKRVLEIISNEPRAKTLGVISNRQQKMFRNLTSKSKINKSLLVQDCIKHDQHGVGSQNWPKSLILLLMK
jgi:hypothetical protein